MSLPIEESIGRIQALLRERRSREALELAVRVTEANEGRGDAWYFRSLAEQQLGHGVQARTSARRALSLDPSQPFFAFQLGRLSEDAGDVEDALAAYALAAEGKPDWFAALSARGALLVECGRPADALTPLLAALELDRSSPTAWNNVGLAHAALHRREEARRAFETALSRSAGYAMAHFNLARLDHAEGRYDAALARAREAVRLDPALVDAKLFIGDLLRREGQDERAATEFREVIAREGAPVRAALAATIQVWDLGHPEEARANFAAIHRASPKNLRAALGCHLLLPQVYSSHDELAECRSRFRSGLERLAESPERFVSSRPDTVLQDIRWCNFYLPYQGFNDRELQSAYGDFIHAILVRGAPRWLDPPARRQQGTGRLRIGFASHFLFDCTVGRYFSSWILELDPARFEIFLYSTNAAHDDRTKRLKAKSDAFRDLAGLPIASMASAIRGDGLDVLVYPELGMHPETFALASLRLAPVQCAGWGHPTTTGLPTIDAFLGAAAMEGGQAVAAYRERLLLLPGLGTRYETPEEGERAGRGDLGLPADRRLYLVPQSIFKIHPDNDALIADVLASDPDAAAVFFAAGPRAPIDAFVRRMKPVFESRGLDTRRHLVFLPYMTHAAYLAVNRCCDVMLDTRHWSGGNTSLDAIATGLPIVTWPGELMRGRQSAAMLAMASVDDLVVRSHGDYVALASDLGRDRDRREDVSRRLRLGAEGLFDQGEPARDFGALIERLAREA